MTTDVTAILRHTSLFRSVPAMTPQPAPRIVIRGLAFG